MGSCDWFQHFGLYSGGVSVDVCGRWCARGLCHSSLQKRHKVRSARVRRHAVLDNLAPLAEHSAYILVPPGQQTPAQCGFFRSHLLVICAAKPRYTAAAAREHRRVLAPRLPTPAASVTSPVHVPREVLFEMSQRRVLLARKKGEVRQVQFCKWTTTKIPCSTLYR